MSESITLGYWGIRGRGQVPRLLLAYTGAEWNEKKYFSQDDWKGIGKDQTSLGLPFPNLPYLTNGDFKLTESKAIMNYIINISDKKELLGKNLNEEAIVGNVVSVFTEILGKIIELVFDHENFDKKKPDVEKFIESKLESLEQMSHGNDFVLGYLTLADFIIAETSYYVENVFPELYYKYQSLSLIRESFENVKEIHEYYQQKNAVKRPFLPPIGKVKF